MGDDVVRSAIVITAIGQADGGASLIVHDEIELPATNDVVQRVIGTAKEARTTAKRQVVQAAERDDPRAITAINAIVREWID